MEKRRAWEPKTKEDRLLHAYWKKIGGIIYTEVPIGGPGGRGEWPIGCTRRRLDGVRIVTGQKEIRNYIAISVSFSLIVIQSLNKHQFYRAFLKILCKLILISIYN